MAGLEVMVDVLLDLDVLGVVLELDEEDETALVDVTIVVGELVELGVVLVEETWVVLELEEEDEAGLTAVTKVVVELDVLAGVDEDEEELEVVAGLDEGLVVSDDEEIAELLEMVLEDELEEEVEVEGVEEVVLLETVEKLLEVEEALGEKTVDVAAVEVATCEEDGVEE